MGYVLYLVLTYYLITTMAHCENGLYVLCNGRVEHNVDKNRSIMSNSVSQDCSKNEPNTWVIKSGGDNGMSIWSSFLMPIFFLHIPFFFFFLPTCGDAPQRPPCNTFTVSKAIKRCSNSRTLKGFIRAVLSTRHLPGRLAVARVTLTNGNWRQEGRRNTRESQSCYA